MESKVRTYYRVGATIRLLGSLAVSMLFFMVAIGTATIQKEYLRIGADEPQLSEPLDQIQSGQSTGYNLLLAGGLSVMTTYFFLRRHVEDENISHK